MEGLCVSSQRLLWLILLPPVLICVSYVWTFVWLRPERLRQKLRRQGVKGPKPSLFLGNIPEMRRIQKQLDGSEHQEQQEAAAAGASHRFSSDYMAALFPYFVHWNRVYGSIYLYSVGSVQSLFVTDPDMVKELANCKSLDLGKPRYLQKQLGALLGTGILTANGDLWAHERKVIAPHFFMDKVKGMVGLMAESAKEMLALWENEVDRGGGSAEVVVDEFLRNFSADVISRASFGSSFAQGKEIFSKIRQLQVAMAKQDIFTSVPGSRYLPTKRNREIRRLSASIRDLILNIARKHNEEHDPPATSSSSSSSASTIDGLLRSIVKGSNSAPAAAGASSSSRTSSPEDFIVDNCKNIYFAGHETTSTTAAWCLLLLAVHPDWQSRARSEVIAAAAAAAAAAVDRRGEAPLVDAEMIRKLKTVTMVIQETLRLYPPAPFVTRETLRDLTLPGGKLRVPGGLGVRVPIAAAHRDAAAWGANADEFDPGRFANGVAGACTPAHMYMPFGVGARTCAGQNLAVVELKVLLALVLPRFEFALSPGYVHRPVFRLTVEPGNGVALVIRKVCSDGLFYTPPAWGWLFC